MSQFDVSPSEYGSLISQLLQKIDYQLPDPYSNPELELALVTYIKEQPWSDNLKARSVKYAEQAVALVSSSYRRASFNFQFSSMTLTFLLITYDEEYANYDNAGTEFSTNLISGQPQSSPFLDSMAQ